MNTETDFIPSAKQESAVGVTFSDVMTEHKSTITQQDFETYAAKALSFADHHHFGVVNKDDLVEAVTSPDKDEDAKTREAMRFMLDHYDFMEKFGDSKDIFKVKGDSRFVGMSGGTPLYESDDPKTVSKSGITLDTIATVSSVLDGRVTPSWEQLKKERGYDFDGMITGGLLGSAAGGVLAGGALGCEALAATGVAVLGIAAGAVVIPIVALGAAGYYIGREYDKAHYRNGVQGQYNSFLSDISGTDRIRTKYFQT